MVCCFLILQHLLHNMIDYKTHKLYPYMLLLPRSYITKYPIYVAIKNTMLVFIGRSNITHLFQACDFPYRNTLCIYYDRIWYKYSGGYSSVLFVVCMCNGYMHAWKVQQKHDSLYACIQHEEWWTFTLHGSADTFWKCLLSMYRFQSYMFVPIVVQACMQKCYLKTSILFLPHMHWVFCIAIIGKSMCLCSSGLQAYRSIVVIVVLLWGKGM